MSEPYTGEIRAVSFDFAPRNWARCDGQLLSINANQALFAVLETRYGGDGVTSFALPDLRARTPQGAGQGPRLQDYPTGRTSGASTVALQLAELPQHVHQIRVAEARTSSRAAGNADAPGGPFGPFASSTNDGGTTVAGAGAGHENLPPYATVSFIICLSGVFPSRS